MGGDYDSLDYWRRFFRTAPKAADIFEVVEHAIMVAAADNPVEFRRRRDRIAELLFTATLRFPIGERFPASSTGEPTPNPRSEVDQEEEGDGDGSVREKEGGDGTMSNYSFDEAAALTEEMEERSQYVAEVFRIKEVLMNKDCESDSVLLDCLQRLQLLNLSYDTLSATAIGKAVNGLRKHSSKQIRNLMRTLIDGWKVVVDEWVKNTSVIAEKSPDSVNPSSTLDEEGLPSPPMDEGALLATHANMNIQLSEFFEGMDDDGNPRTSMDSENRRGCRDNSSAVNKKQHLNRSFIREDDVRIGRQQHTSHLDASEDYEQIGNKQQTVNQQMRKQDQANRHVTRQEAIRGEVMHHNLSKQNRLSSNNAGPSRPPKPSSDQKTNNQIRCVPREDKAKHRVDDFEDDLKARLEVAKRKLHVGYQAADNAKKQRTIQVVEPNDLPKQPTQHRLPNNIKPKNNNLRNRLIGRR